MLARPSLRLRLAAYAVALLALVLIIWLDYVTGPNLDLSITFFLPITLGAWFISRPFAITLAVLATLPYAVDQIVLFRAGEQSSAVASLDTLVRMMVFLFAAEATYRLRRRNSEIAASALQLQERNQEIHRTYSLLDEDLRTAGALQAALVKSAPLRLPGVDIGIKMSFPRPVGGDLAVAGVVDDLVYACIADISGKGTPAALFTALLKHLLDEALGQGLRGSQAIEYVNAALVRALPLERFVTLIYLEIEPDSGSMRFVNAGHPEGLEYHSGTRSLQYLAPTSGILGVDSSMEIKTGAGSIAPGDAVLLYTDGATESLTLDGTRLGDERIGELAMKYAELDAQGTVDAIVADIEAMTVPEARDDLSLICVRRK